MDKTVKTVLVVGVVGVAGFLAYKWYERQKAVATGTATTTVKVGEVANPPQSETAQIISASGDALGALGDLISKTYGSN